MFANFSRKDVKTLLCRRSVRDELACFKNRLPKIRHAAIRLSQTSKGAVKPNGLPCLRRTSLQSAAD